MAVTYTIGTNAGHVRRAISDTTLNAGPRPADANFSDDEISAALTAEGNWQRAVAFFYETLAAEWARYPSFEADNFAMSRSHIARQYDRLAERWRARFGHGVGTVATHPVIPADGYSDDIDTHEVT